MLITVYVDSKGAIWALYEGDITLTKLQFEVENAEEIKNKIKEHFDEESD